MRNVVAFAALAGLTAAAGAVATAAPGGFHALRPAPQPHMAYHAPRPAPVHPARLRPAPAPAPHFGRPVPVYRPAPQPAFQRVPHPRVQPAPQFVHSAPHLHHARPVHAAAPAGYAAVYGHGQPHALPAYGAGYPPATRTRRPKHNNLIKVGALSFFPQDSSSAIRGDLTPENLRVDVNNRTVLAGSYTRHFGDRFGVEIPFGAPTTFGISAAGPGEGFLSPLTESLSGQEIATVDALPATVIGNVYFTDRDATVRPYVGLGLNHTIFSNEKAGANLERAILGETTIELEDSTNVGAFAGVNVRLTDRLHASLLAGFVNVDTTATITTDTVLPLTPEFGIPLGEFTREVDVELNPVIGLASIGFSF